MKPKNPLLNFDIFNSPPKVGTKTDMPNTNQLLTQSVQRTKDAIAELLEVLEFRELQQEFNQLHSSQLQQQPTSISSSSPLASTSACTIISQSQTENQSILPLDNVNSKTEKEAEVATSKDAQIVNKDPLDTTALNDPLLETTSLRSASLGRGRMSIGGDEDPLQEIIDLLIKKLQAVSIAPPIHIMSPDSWGASDPLFGSYAIGLQSSTSVGLGGSSAGTVSLSTRELAYLLALCFGVMKERMVGESGKGRDGQETGEGKKGQGKEGEERKNSEETEKKEKEEKVVVLEGDKELFPLLLQAYQTLLFHLPTQPTQTPMSPSPLIRNIPLPTPTKTSSVFKLPPEILLRILMHTRTLEPTASSDTHFGYPSSRSLLQTQLHTLATVCKMWEPAARRAAYCVVHLRRKEQMDKLLSTLTGEGGERLGNMIREVDVKMSGSGTGRSIGRRGRVTNFQNVGGPFGWMHTGGAGHPFFNSSSIPLASSDTCGTALGKMLERAPNVQNIQVAIANTNPGYGYSIGAEFLEATLLESVCGLRGLRSVTLRQSLDFGDLQDILWALPSIRHLSLPSGVTNLSSLPTPPNAAAQPGHGVNTMTTMNGELDDEPHRARLLSFQCSNWDFPSITSEQLVWILKPAQHSIKTLDLGSWSGGNGGFGINNGQQGRNPPWATGTFADLLKEMGGSVTQIALRDLHGLGVVDQSLRNSPHNGYLDYAISHCIHLTELALDWSFTGPDFLGSLSRNIESLLMFGAPSNALAKDMMDLVESENSKLCTLVLSAWPAGVPGTWSSREIRALRSSCHAKGCLFAFTGGS